MRAKFGAPKAITATAHKLARIVYHLLITRQPYDETRLAKAEHEHRQRTESRLRAQARALGFQLVPASEQAVPYEVAYPRLVKSRLNPSRPLASLRTLSEPNDCRAGPRVFPADLAWREKVRGRST